MEFCDRRSGVPLKLRAYSQHSYGRWFFQVLDAVLESLHFRIEGAYCGTVTSLTRFDGRRPGVKGGEQFCFDALQLKADPLLVIVSQRAQRAHHALCAHIGAIALTIALCAGSELDIHFGARITNLFLIRLCSFPRRRRT